MAQSSVCNLESKAATVFPQNLTAFKILFQGSVWCGENLRIASTEIDEYVALTIRTVGTYEQCM